MVPRPAPVLVLAPIDQGVRNVGGRDGAAAGPPRLAGALKEVGLSLPHVDLPVENTDGSLEADLDLLSEAVETLLADGKLPVVLGGDHGTTYATVRGMHRALGAVGVAYFDVHLDLRDFRPRHTSGSSFRRLVDERLVPAEFVRPLGTLRPTDPAVLARSRFDELAAWAAEKGVRYRTLDEVRGMGVELAVDEALGPERAWCYSLDIDALDERWAPGVSAPGKGRFTLEEAEGAVKVAAPRVRVFDLVEYAPRLDRDDATLTSAVRLLATLLRTRGAARA